MTTPNKTSHGMLDEAYHVTASALEKKLNSVNSSFLRLLAYYDNLFIRSSGLLAYNATLYQELPTHIVITFQMNYSRL